MKKLGIDARLYYQTGVGVYLRNLLFYIDKIAPKNLQIIAYVLSSDVNKVRKVYKNITVRGVSSKWHTLSEQFIFLIALLKDRLDLMHFTYFSFPIFYNKKFISTIHDTTLLKHKTGKASTKSSVIYNLKHNIFRIVFYTQVKKSKKIITPTKYVKKQILDSVKGVDTDKIIPIYEGVTREYLEVKKVKSNNKLKVKYFLYVGTFYPHKNVESLIKAYSKLKTDINLYLVGPDDFFSKKIIELISQLNLNNRVKIFKNIENKKLPDFYKNAIALIHPSKSEGFGLPIIEAAHFKIPIIASNIDVFKELLDNAFVSFDPYDLNDIENKISYFIKKRPSFNYKDRLKDFSFKKMSKKTLELYKDVLNI
ncbi:MAG: glycosyltransferase family 1 protein [Patescibacteria group bacterium]